MRNRVFILAVLLATRIFAADAVTISVDPQPRQTFAGLGAGVGNWGMDYQKLTAAEREELSKLIWGDLHMTSIRLWINLNEYAPTPQRREIKNFVDRYITSGLLADAQKHGVKTILLAPDNAPPWLKTKRDGGAADFSIADDKLDDYADVLADFIADLRKETGVRINVTGIQNEPNDLDRITPQQFPMVVTKLLEAFAAHRLMSVQIISPESANVDDLYYDTIARLKADAFAWKGLAGVASHSYSMGATRRAAELNDGTGKSYWMTEASANGPEEAGDHARAASLAARLFNDLNHGVTHWQHFLAFEIPDPNDNATRIVAFTPNPLKITTFQKYHVYHAFAQAFDVGCVLYRGTSDLDDTMAWTYGKKPRVSTAVAKNPDGTWAVGVANYTSKDFTDAGDADQQNGYAARAFDVTIALPPGVGDRAFTITRLGPDRDGTAPAAETIRVTGDRLVLPAVGPLEVVLARSIARP